MRIETGSDLVLVSNAWRIVEELTDLATAPRTVGDWVKSGRVSLSGERIYLETTGRAGHIYTSKEWIYQFIKQL